MGIYSQSTKELYEDQETGELYTKPGPNRKKIKEKLVSVEEDNRGGFSRVPKNPILEKLTVVGRLQLRGIGGEADSIYSNGHRDFNAPDVNVRRARIGWIYQGDSWWGSTLAIRLEDLVNRPYLVKETITFKDGAGRDITVTRDVNIRDNRGGLQEAFFWFNIPYSRIQLNFGQFVIPFIREFMMTSANMMVVERSFASSAYPQMDWGGMISINPLKEIDAKYDRYLTIQAGVFNGKGSGLDGIGRQQTLTQTRNNTQPLLISPLYVWRIQYNPFGGLIKDGKDVGWIEGEEIFQKDLKWSLGIAGMQTKESSATNNFNTQTRGYDPFPIFLVQTTPSNGIGLGGTGAGSDGIVVTSSFNNPGLNTITNANRPSLGVVGHTYDSTFTWNGIYLSSAYTVFRGAASRDAKMFHGTIGYNFEIGNFYLMPVFRYETISADFDLNKEINDKERFRSYWIGANLFGDGHLFKAQLFYQILNDRLAYDAIARENYDARNNILYFQLQATFWTGVRNLQVLNSVR
ncbi:hypothetical protein LPTSP4_15990 [Leptospira ryugenii]|uniref:Porin n=2 Tax=Leptospira ryugenii TaxID=1917863 RepID=A0A2P2DZS4_9LEPT|nr:hypothetical protein LPTSP4_15990 [Leptospira ryugenii]